MNAPQFLVVVEVDHAGFGISFHCYGQIQKWLMKSGKWYMPKNEAEARSIKYYKRRSNAEKVAAEFTRAISYSTPI